MDAIRLSPLDAGFLYTESDAAPNHVGGLLQFRLPEGAPRDFLRKMMLDFRSQKAFAPPWNRKLKLPIKKNPAPSWVEDDDIDLEYHVRHTALPWPGGERELGELVARLHSTPLDLNRPLWECIIIEGLEDNRFALFVKIHHALVDGVSGMKMLQRSMATSEAASRKLPPFWCSRKREEARPARDARAPTLANALAGIAGSLRGQLATAPRLLGAFAQLFTSAAVPQAGGMVVPFMSPRTMFNGRVRSKRRFATAQFSIERLRGLAQGLDGTLNDVVLAICGAALRRFLEDRGELPDLPLSAAIPVSMRPKDDEGGGNAITFIISSLGTDVSGPLERVQAIRASVKQAKDHLQSLPRQAMQQYTLLLMAPTILALMTGTAGRVRPMYNVMVSNVPGPEQTLYFRGAEMVGCYPVSVVTHGQALNITCQSYAGNMNFGVIGCHASVPSLQKIAVYLNDAVEELEASLRPRPAAKKRGAVAKKAAAKEAVATDVVAQGAAAKGAVAKKAVAKKSAAGTVASKKAVAKKAASTKKAAGKKTAAQPAQARSAE